MILKYSDNIFKQVGGVIHYNRVNIAIYSLVSFVAVTQYELGEAIGYQPISFPAVPITLLGSALAIFLGFRNNSAYDRWWEARKIWGGIVNTSRTWGMMVTTFISAYRAETQLSGQIVNVAKEELVKRHIAWLYALVMHLRKFTNWDDLNTFIPEEEVVELKAYHNKPCHLLHKQAEELQKIHENQLIDDFRHIELSEVLKDLYDLQGKAERIKGTVFPYYYNYFTKAFLWLFVLCLPFALAPIMEWGAIFMSISISFVFTIIEKSGAITEDPFENRAADTPISTIARNIEIDLLEMIRSKIVPAPAEVKVGRFGVQYMD
ncbi:MAG: bestrophin family ion channel [Bacteroidota bacterium]